MAKKNFSQGINAILGDAEVKPSKKEEVEHKEEKAVHAVEKRATFIVDVDLLEKLKALAFWERDNIKNIFKEALSNYISEIDPAVIKEALRKYREKKS